MTDSATSRRPAARLADERTRLLEESTLSESSPDSSSLASETSSDDGINQSFFNTINPDVEHARTAEDGAPRKSDSTRTSDSILSIIAILLLGSFASNADGSLVLATHPAIGSEFNDLEDSSWLFTGFALAGSATQSLFGKLSEIYGRKVILLWAYGLFALGCGVIGLGQSMWQVILGRVISGAGGSAMTTVAAVLITDLVPLRNVAFWQSFVNVAATTGRSLGAPVGGWLADTIGWRWSFFGQAPMFLLAMLLGWIFLPNTKRSSGESEEPEAHPLARIDFLGATLLAAFMLTFLLPLELGGVKIPWTHPLIFIFAGAAVVFGGLFLATEAWWARDPVFPLVLLRHRDVVASYFVMGCQIAAQLGLMYSVPLYFQVTERASNTVAGAHLFPAVAGNAVGGILSGLIIKRTGRYKLLVVSASLISSISYILLLIRWHGHTNFWESLYIIPGGFGTGIAQSAVFISLQAAIDPKLKAPAISGLFLIFPVGMIVGLACVSAVLLEVLQQSLEGRLVDLGLDPITRTEIIKNAISNVDYIDHVDGRTAQAVVASYVDGLTYTHGVSLLFALCGCLCALLLRERRL